MNLFLIDAIGPFFHGYRKTRINWSKIPFENLERDGRLDPARMAAVESDFTRFCDAAADLGCNGITLDDLAHLALHPAYPQDLASRLAHYRDAYRRLFDVADARGLTVYVTTDVAFAPVQMPGLARQRLPDLIQFYADASDALFRDFDRVGGIIFRIGECDAGDVRGDFRSHLALHTAGQAHAFIHGLLPVFERHDRLMIFRTWTVGAHPIGDLIWNRRTYDQAFRGLDERSHFVLSMKYGETDFFRYLPLNKLFFRGGHRKIVEFQARREYEGFGEYPSFVGWDYEVYLHQLKTARNIDGVWVWCQTGGWSGFRRRSYLDAGAVWNEINTDVTLRMAREGCSAAEAVAAFARHRLGTHTEARLLRLLRLSERVVREGLYIEDIARRKLFFRRLRIPPLLSVFWDHILVNHSMRKLMRCFVQYPEARLSEGRHALRRIREMQSLAREIGLPAGDFDFQYDTFALLAAARAYYLRPYTPSRARRLERMKAGYYARFPVRYTVHLDFSPLRLRRAHLRILLALLLRSHRGYRRVDRLLLMWLIALLAPAIVVFGRRAAGQHLTDQAMGIDAIMR